MCSPAQAVGGPSLSQEIEDMTTASDALVRQQRRQMRTAASDAHAGSLQDQRDALTRAGKRFGRQSTLTGKNSQQSDALGGAIWRRG